jgi:hypothetical protein
MTRGQRSRPRLRIPRRASPGRCAPAATTVLCPYRRVARVIAPIHGTLHTLSRGEGGRSYASPALAEPAISPQYLYQARFPDTFERASSLAPAPTAQLPPVEGNAYTFSCPTRLLRSPGPDSVSSPTTTEPPSARFRKPPPPEVSLNLTKEGVSVVAFAASGTTIRRRRRRRRWGRSRRPRGPRLVRRARRLRWTVFLRG